VNPDLLSAGVRALAFVALFQATGVALFLAGFGRLLTAAQAGVRRLGLIAAAAGVVLVLAHLSLDPARMAGDFAGVWDPDLQQLAWHSSSGLSQVTQIVGLLVVLAALSLSGPHNTAPQAGAVIGAVIAIGAFLLTGHTSTHPLRALLAPLLALHLLIVAFWFGALLPLAMATRIETPATAVRILRRFSRVAAVLVPLIGAAGLAMAFILCPGLGVLRQPYGQLLLAKLGGFVVLLALAAWNRWRLVPALALAADTGAAAARRRSALQRSIATEYLLIVAVLCITDVLTTFFSPS
jgi:putative copper export protein